MKLREFFYCLGLKPKPRKYAYELREQSLRGQIVRYAQWLHPRAYPCEIQERELKSLEAFLSPGDVAIDIGAHMGDSTLPMALVVGASGCVIALEANPYVFETLEANAQANPQLTNIHAFNLAATDENRPFEFSYNDPGFMNGGAVETQRYRRGAAFRQTVQGVRLGDFMNEQFPELIDRIRYIKIDTEGYDLYVLRSITDLLKRAQPFVQAEVMKGTPAQYRNELFDFLKSLGYQVFFSTNCQHAAQEMSREELMEHENFDVFCVPKHQVQFRVAAA